MSDRLPQNRCRQCGGPGPPRGGPRDRHAGHRRRARAGRRAVREYSEKFDGWSPDSFRLDAEEIEKIVAGVPAQVDRGHHRGAGRGSARFAQHQKDSLQDFEIETEPGVFLGQRNIPVAAAGAYVPGGRYPLVASAHMTVVTAKVAGVERVTACTPPIRGEIPAATVAAMHLAGADEIFLLGGIAGGRRDGHRHRDDRQGRPARRTRQRLSWPRPSGSCSARSASTSSPGPPRS